MNNMLFDLLAGLSFYIVPYLTGRIFVKKTVQAWILGALAWFIIYFAVFGAGIFIHFDFQNAIKVIAAAISVVSLLNIGRQLLGQKPKIHWQNIFIALALGLFTAFVYFFVWKRSTPYPLQLNWDIYEHITLANLISAGKLSFLTTHISDTFTFNSSSPIFGILLSLPKILFQRGLLGIYWGLEYWHYLLTAFAAFILAKKVFNNNWLAFLAAIVSSLVFESVVVYSTLFLIPQTLVALITIFVAAEIKAYKWPMLLVAAIVILLMHYVVGVLCLFILAALYVSLHINFSKKRINLAIIASSLIALILVVSNLFISWSVPGIEEAGHFNFQLMPKIGFIIDWYGIFLFVFGLIGGIKIVKDGTYSQKILLCLALIVLGIAFAPFSYFLKFYVLSHYFWSLVIALGIWVLISNLSSILKFASIVFVAFVLLVTFYKNQLVYKEPLNFKSYETQISYSEIQAGNWLTSQNKDGKAFLISDPATQYILEAVSGVNSQGGMYMDLNTRRSLESINGYYDANTLKNKLLSVKDLVTTQTNPQKTYFVVGGRYFTWQRLPISQKDSTFYNVWAPKELTQADKTYVDYYKRIGLKVVFSNKEIVIFAL
jgi:hypothetical protein